jgi:hypothetical protein
MAEARLSFPPITSKLSPGYSAGMEQKPAFIKISDLVAAHQMVRPLIDKALRAQHALNLIEETFHAIEAMDNSQRDETMRVLRAWLVAEKFGPESRIALSGYHRYCIAECLSTDVNWQPPTMLPFKKWPPGAT